MIDPVAINALFASYYSALYSSKADYSGEELDFFLGQITFLTLADEARKRLDSSIILGEVLQGLCELQVGKTPGVNSLPPEFYKPYGEQLSPKLNYHLV